jgi:hypothetical protein
MVKGDAGAGAGAGAAIRAWLLIKQSILRCLWSSPEADSLHLQLTCRPDMKMVKQYARALNSAFVKVNKPQAASC